MQSGHILCQLYNPSTENYVDNQFVKVAFLLVLSAWVSRLCQLIRALLTLN